MRKGLLLLAVCLISTLSAFSQDQWRQNGNAPARRAWPQINANQQQQQQTPNRSGQFSAAEYSKQQQKFFTEKAELTEQEAQAFFPLYNELQQKKRQLNMEIRRIMRQEPGTAMTEEQSLKAINARAQTNIKIAELENEYLEKFKQVLPASKILKIQNAEEQFNSQLLKDIQQTRGHQFQQMQPNRQQPQTGQPRPQRQAQ